MKIAFIILLVVAVFFLYRALFLTSKPPAIGQNAPAFKLKDTHNKEHQLEDYAGKWLVLYFYPKDDTPGCTKEACHFRDDLFKLEKLGAKVVGVSVDSTNSHAEFAKKYSLPFPLLADTDGKVAASYGSLNHLGVIKIAKRYTFLIDTQGKVAKIYTDVNTQNHSEEILNDLTLLQQQPQ